MELTRQVPIKISEEAHAKATADAKAQGSTIAKHLSKVVDAMILTPPAPALAETPAEQSAPIGFVQTEPEQPAPAPAEQPETKVVAEPAQAPYVFQGI